MPPRKRMAPKRFVPDEASSLPRDPAPAPKGRGRGSGKGRGRGVGRIPSNQLNEAARIVGGEVPEPRQTSLTLTDVVAGMRDMQQTMREMIGMVQQQQQAREQHINPEPQQEAGLEREQPALQGRADVIHLSEFMRLKPPSFTGTMASEDPQYFLDEIGRLCRALGCTPTRSVELVEFRLLGMAKSWFDIMMEGRPRGSPPLVWEEFTELFMKRFLPQSVRDAKAKEFEVLKQSEDMTVAEYDALYTQMSRYAPHLVATEQMRAKRFVEGLLDYLFRSVANI